MLLLLVKCYFYWWNVTFVGKLLLLLEKCYFYWWNVAFIGKMLFMLVKCCFYWWNDAFIDEMLLLLVKCYFYLWNVAFWESYIYIYIYIYIYSSHISNFNTIEINQIKTCKMFYRMRYNDNQCLKIWFFSKIDAYVLNVWIIM